MEKRKKRFGDRPEGRKLRSLDALNGFTPFIMKKRSDATNYFEGRVDITEANRYLRKKRLDGEKNMGFLHLFIAAYVRTVSQLPGINRFIAGQRTFARYDVEMVMTVKKTMAVDGSETTFTAHFDQGATLSEVYEQINREIEFIKKGEEDTGTDKVAGALMKLPRMVLRFAIGVLKLLDYYGLLPKSLLHISPFHGSIIITDLGSLGIPPVYHHIYDFGTLPVFFAFGAKYREYILNRKGEMESHYFIDYKVSTDERICDGYYYAKAFKLMMSYLKNPEKLEVPPEKIVEDVD